MPIHGKIVVINRSGTDGIEFPLTANCLFGRRPDCHIRIQLPHVSKEHCRIDLNENKEVVLTNLSSVNPTRVNGEILQQSERLKHGDVITIIDRSFRFEYPPAPTPKKRSSTGSKTKTLKVFQDSQLVDAVAETGEKRVSEVFTDGTNHDNIQRSLEKTMEFESKEDDSQKTISPFNDLYQMIRKSFDDKTTKRSSTTSLLQTPATKFCTPKTKQKGNPPTSTGSESTPKKDDAKVMVGADENAVNGTPRSLKKQRESSELSTKTPVSAAEEAKDVTKSETASLQKNNNSTPEEFTVQEVIEQTCDQSKSPMRRKSRGVTPTNPVMTENQEEPTSTQKARRVSPRNVVTAEKVKQLPKKRKSGELSSQLSLPQGKKKRVSFGGYLSPELFDKRLPPNSPLCKGATPRRSLCLLKSKQSLLRRASVIGLVKEFDTEQQKAESPKKQTPKKSPTNKKASQKAPTPEKKSPKSNTPKVASPGAKMPTSRSSSPRAASPGNKMPSSKASPKTPGGVTKNETPQSNKQPKTPGQATPGKTPVNPDTFTPTVQGRFSVSRISTPSPVSENAAPEEMPAVGVTPRRKSMRSTTKKTPVVSISAVKVMRRSGISRASMKIKTSFADIVKFGQAKTSAVALAKKQVVKKPTRKAAPKPQTPARKLQDHVSTGHADSPMTIVVGRAHKRQVVQPTGAAPRMVTNVILGKKIMKMDEDLTGISEMFKTPAHGRKRKSIMDKSLTESPKGLPSTPVVDPSVLNTPEEPGEMMVSPLSVVSTGRGRRFTSEAVQRLLKEEQESSFVNDVLVLETEEESSDPQSGEGPVETPKQKPDQPLFLTPRPRVEPLDDLRGTLLKTPKQKPEQKDCLTGVKRIMKTPRDTIEPVEDIRGRLLVTPKQKPEPRDCLTGVKEIFDIPQWEDKVLEDLQGKLETPDASKAEGMSPVASEMMDMLTPNVKATQMECLTGVKRIMKTPKEKGTPVEDMVGVKRILTTPRQKGEPVEDNFGIKRLVKSPKQRGNAPVEDFEGLQQLMEEPLSDRAEAIIVELEDQAVPNCGVDIPQEATVSDQTSEMLPEDACEPSPAQETVLGTTVVDSVPVEEPIEAAEILNVPEERAEEEISVDTVTQMSPVVENAPEKKPVRGQRARAAESNEAEGSIPLGSEVTEAPATVKGRRGKKPEATVTSTVRQTTRSRNAKTETQEIKVAVEQFTPKSLIKSKKGRNAEKALEAEMVQEARNKMEVETEGEQNLPVEDNPPTNDHVVPEEKLDSKPKRGRKIKHPEIHEYVPEQRDLNTGATDLCDDLVEVVPTGNDDNKLSEVMETAAQVPVTETLFSVEADKDASIVQKKSGPGTRAKMPEIKQEGGDMSEDNTITASVRGRRGRKIEAVVLPAARQTTRARKVRLQETNSNDNSEVVPEKSAETQPTAEENKTEENAVVKPRRGRKATQTPSVPPKTEKENMVELKAVGNVSQEENDSVIKEAVVKPTRGRKAKLTSVKPPQPEPEKTEDEVDQIYSHATQEENEFTQMAPVRPVREKRTKQKPASELPQTEPEKTEVDEPVVQEPQHTTVTKKPRKGRKIQCDAVEQNDITAVVKTKQESQPSVRTRGRNAKQEEKVMKNSTDLARSSFTDDPIKKLKRTRKTEQDDVEPRKEIQAEVVVPQEAEVKSAVEPQEIIPVSVKPRRGRLAKKCHDDEISESIEVKEVPAVQSRKPRQGRRGVTVEEDVATVEVLEENSENLPEAENAIEPDTPVTKAVRRRGVKTSIKDESSQVNPAKRARRGATAAPAKEASVEPTLKPSSPVSNPVELPKRGRRVAAAVTKLRLDKPLVSNDLPDLPDDSKNAADPQDPKTNKRAVRWKVDMEVFDIPKSTPGKPVRGRRTKLVDQVEQEKKDDTSKSEEKDLSGEVVEVQPMKKARRGAKVNEKPKTHVEPEIQPQTRRGRSARK